MSIRPHQERVGIWGETYLAVACGTVSGDKTKSEKLFSVTAPQAIAVAVVSGLTCKRGERVNSALYWPLSLVFVLL